MVLQYSTLVIILSLTNNENMRLVKIRNTGMYDEFIHEIVVLSEARFQDGQSKTNSII